MGNAHPIRVLLLLLTKHAVVVSAGRMFFVIGSTQFNCNTDEIEQWDDKLNAVLRVPMVAQLCALLEAGLLHMSMASEFGEMQRKAACENPLFWWRMEEPVCSDRPASITPDMTQQFFGLPG